MFHGSAEGATTAAEGSELRRTQSREGRVLPRTSPWGSPRWSLSSAPCPQSSTPIPQQGLDFLVCLCVQGCSVLRPGQRGLWRGRRVSFAPSFNLQLTRELCV